MSTESMVTQADENAVKAFAQEPHVVFYLTNTKLEGDWRAALAEAFARHRTAAQPEREAVLEEALKNIAAPVAYLQRQAEAAGNKLDGATALAIAGNAEFLKRIAREALDAAALSAIEGREGWQPIATAPRDGTRIDVWTNLDDRWTNVWWEPAKQDWLHWWADAWGGMGAQRLGAAPTHWRPLPAPPSGDEE